MVEDIIKKVKEKTDTIILSFSCGKESIVMWLILGDHFRIIPLYLYIIPGLGFVEESLKYYEGFFCNKIYQRPSQLLINMLRNCIFSAPSQFRGYSGLRLRGDYYGIIDDLKEELGIGDAYIANGMRANENLFQRLNLRKTGPIKRERKIFYPMHDWTNTDVEREIKKANIRLPIDYKLFGRSFNGIGYRFLKPIRERFPEDYKLILDWFPLAELEIKRMEYRDEHFRQARSE